MKTLKRIALLALPIAAVLFWPNLRVGAQGTGSFVRIASVTTTAYTDTACPKGGTCQYYVSATAPGVPESAPSSTVAVLNNGAIGNIALSWNPGACPAGKTCTAATGYNVYGAYPTVPPAGLAGASN